MSEQLIGRLEWSSAGYGTKAGIVTDEYFIRRPGDDVAVASDVIDPETSKPSEGIAKRLAACWNACDGITTQALEYMRYPFGQLLSQSFQTVADHRDQLIAALSGLVLFSKPTQSNAVALNNAHQVLKSVTGGVQVQHPAIAQRDELLAALKLYEGAHSDLFAQCCSNPITNAWGKEVNMTSFNLAHESASTAIKKIEGGAQ